MAKAMNAVLAGDFARLAVKAGPKGLYLTGKTRDGFFYSWIDINRSTVAQYELITDEHRKSAVSGVARGLVGGALLGPVGMLAGAVSAKSKGIYQVAVLFNSDDPRSATCGKRSLLELDDALYKKLIAACF